MPRVVNTPGAGHGLESAIVRTVRGLGAVSRVELARELALVPSTAGVYVDRLIGKGYLVEAAAETARTIGRPPKRVELNPAGGRFVGVDFDARQVMAVVVDFALRPLRRVERTLPVRATAERVLAVIEETIAEVIGPDGRAVLGVGLGVPGVVDSDRGVALAYRFIRDWRDVPIGPRVAARFGVPAFVENNLRSMALGELWCGEERGLRNLVCLGIRSGIGAGIVVGGQLLRGAGNTAGEIGRWTCPDWDTDRPPRTIEDVASLTAVLAGAAERLRRGAASRLGSAGVPPTATDLVAAAAAGDSLAASLVHDAARMHGWVLHQLTTLLDPERVVVAGPLAESDVYLADLRRAATALDGPALAGRVTRSTLGPFAGAVGAAALAFHHWSPPRAERHGGAR